MKDVADKRWLKDGDGRKWTEHDEQVIDDAFLTGFTYIALLLALIFVISALSTLAHAETVKSASEKNYNMSDTSLNKVDRKLLISPEMKSYKKRISHARVKDLGGVE
ncbi:MAG: hypothetical protein ACXV8I_00030 [Methylobacter sp.]